MPEDYVPAAEGLAAQVVEVKKKVRIPVEAQKELHVCRDRLVPGFHPYAQPESCIGSVLLARLQQVLWR